MSPEQATSNSKNKGLFLVIEGSDGSGKSTQYKLLTEKLQKAGLPVKTIKFPQYEEDSSYFVRKYLSGDYGTADEIGPYTPSLFYALDRYDTGIKIREWLAQGYVVLADRYIGANKAHQGQKIDDQATRLEYYKWLDQLEFEMLDIPKPNLNIVLTVPVETAIKLIDKRGDAQVKDIHDSDAKHLERATSTYKELCQLYPETFVHINCVAGGELMSIENINNLIWERVQPMLPKIFKKGDNKGESEHEAKKFVEKQKDGTFKVLDNGKAWLDEAVTDRNGDVYAFTNHLNPATVAAAMARLSRRGDDMRVTLLEEFAAGGGYDENLLRRVITAYGDDSVQQLSGTHIVVENASNLLTKKLEWGRLAAYLEQSTRYIYFDKKDANGKYRYYTPDLRAGIKTKYTKTMDKIFDTYAKMVHDLTDYVRNNSKTPKNEQDAAWRSATKAQACDAVRGVLPVATTSTVGIYGSGQAIESLIMHLQSDETSEARRVGQNMLEQARKVIDVFLERADKPDRGGAWVMYKSQTRDNLTKITQKLVPNNLSNDLASAQLISVNLRNELDLVPYMLYENSELSLRELQNEVSNWSYDKKQQVLQAYIGERLNRRHRPGRALENIHYSWDIVCDYGIFRDLQRHRIVDDLNWQKLTPRYGYEMPKLIEEAGLSEEYEKCFDLSLQLYSDMQAVGYELDAQYATLFGHRMRWKVTYNAREAFHLHELRTSPQGHPGYRKLVMEMHEQVANVHPLLAEAMKFVNTDEDPELARLAAERYTKFKLDKLDK